MALMVENLIKIKIQIRKPPKLGEKYTKSSRQLHKTEYLLDCLMQELCYKGE